MLKVQLGVDCFLGLCSSGGVVLASKDGKIVFENTLDARLDVVFRKKLPEVIAFIKTLALTYLLPLYSSSLLVKWLWKSKEKEDFCNLRV